MERKVDDVASDGSAKPFTLKDIDGVYPELRRIARHLPSLAATLRYTDGLHEGLVNLFMRRERKEWRSKYHFIAEVLRARKNSAIDYVRKRTVRNAAIATSALAVDAEDVAETLQTTDRRDTILEALEDLQKDKAVERRGRMARVAYCRLIQGMSWDETAREVRLSESQARKDFDIFKGWALQWLSPELALVSQAIERLALSSIDHKDRIAQVARGVLLLGQRRQDVARETGRPLKAVTTDLRLFAAFMEKGSDGGQ